MEFSALVTALQKPDHYPDQPRQVEIVQTHISVIFLTGQHAYKIKKPVNFGFLDFTTLEKRKFYCEQEVTLNRRLCPEIYLGVVEIHHHEGRLFLGNGPGEVVEYAVLMKRIPADCMMDRWLARRALDSAILTRVAEKIASFHARAVTSPEIVSFGRISTIQGNVEENFSQAEKYINLSIPAESFAEIKEQSLRFLREQRPLFEERIAAGKIRDCHGDLHLQHICINEGVLIFDCIEFNERFRYSDVAADIAFLLMDLDSHSFPLLSADLASSYLRFSEDWRLFQLLDFYKCYRAYVRGKVISFRLDDPGISPTDKSSARKEARRYFQLAHLYARRLNRPSLLVTCGLMGTGKSTIAQAISQAFGAECLSSDILRKEIAHISPREHRYEEFHRGIYSPDFSQQTYAALLERTQAILQSGRSVILDASFKKQGDRLRALDLASRMRADFLLIECRTSEEEIRRRLARRTAEQNAVSDGRWALFREQKEDFDEVRGLSPDLHLALDTQISAEGCLGIFFQHLLRKAGHELELKIARILPG